MNRNDKTPAPPVRPHERRSTPPSPTVPGGYADDAEARNYPERADCAMFENGGRKVSERAAAGDYLMPDEALREDICAVLVAGGLEVDGIGLETRAGVVVIDGRVPDAGVRDRLLAQVWTVGGVAKVDCRLEVGGR